MATAFMPLKDVTFSRLSMANKPLSAKSVNEIVPAKSQVQEVAVRVRRNDPYNWNWMASPPQVPIAVVATVEDASTSEPESFDSTALCNALVQFKCHHGEYSSTFELRKGQYVVVQGDRGIDIGVVIRMNTEESKQYVERTGPSGPVLRHATQREVDYWATDLKNDELAALDYCKQRILKHRLVMDVRHAEYQFDKKKLTFYYEAKTRVDFVTLLKELFREFSCRIWMEKVRMHE